MWLIVDEIRHLVKAGRKRRRRARNTKPGALSCRSPVDAHGSEVQFSSNAGHPLWHKKVASVLHAEDSSIGPHRMAKLSYA